MRRFLDSKICGIDIYIGSPNFLLLGQIFQMLSLDFTLALGKMKTNNRGSSFESNWKFFGEVKIFGREFPLYFGYIG